MKIKQESSGWPSECITPEQKAKYISEYEINEGVKLDPSSISKNPGRRTVAKLALNSFWGRWGMNLNKLQLSYVSSLEKFNSMFTDGTKCVSSCVYSFFATKLFKNVMYIWN